MKKMTTPVDAKSTRSGRRREDEVKIPVPRKSVCDRRTMNEKLARVRQVFLDMDDTIYRGTTLFPTTLPFLDFLKRRGIGRTFLSNNSSYGKPEYVTRLCAMGIECSEDDFYISTDYTIDFLRRYHPEIRRIHLLGMPAIVPEFAAAGFTVDQRDDRVDAVIIAFDRQLDYERLCRASWLISRGIPGFATHPDPFCPTDQPTLLVDCGAITACIERATGKKLKVLGKPDPGMLIAGAARRGATAAESLMAGDRLATDVAVARNAGALACHITPGCDYTAIPEALRPDFSCRDLGELQKLWED